MRIPLYGGAYATRSNIASVTRAVNLYPEVNPAKQAAAPTTHYQRPGFKLVSRIGLGPIRGIWARTDGNGFYVVSSNNVYYYSLAGGAYTPFLCGSMTTSFSGPVSMVDNGIALFLVDGTATGGYFVFFSNNLLVPIPGSGFDPDSNFQGGSSVDYLDTFLLWSFIGDSNTYGATGAGLPASSSPANAFPDLFTAAKAAYPDPLVKLIVNKRELILMGTLRSEIWYNAGGSQFPFTILPGVYIQHGTCAPASVCAQDIEIYWLSQDAQGNGMVLKQRGYETKRISNHALEYQLRQLRFNIPPGAWSPKGGLSGAIGYIHQSDGHTFYVLTFPGYATWVYDSAVPDPNEAWHQRAWVDSNGNYSSDRSSCGAFVLNAPYGNSFNGIFLVGDYQSNSIYALDPFHYYDDIGNLFVPGAPEPYDPAGQAPIPCVRTFMHIMSGMNQGGRQLIEGESKRIKFSAFYADVECGKVPASNDPPGPQITLRWSNDRGMSWSSGIQLSLGEQGQYQTWPAWRTLGVARDMVFELSWAEAGPVALQGAWVDAEVLDS